SPNHQQRCAPRRLAGSRSTTGLARGEGGGAAAEGRGRRLAKPGERRTSRLLRARAANGGSPLPAHPRLGPRTAPPPLPEPLCEAVAETAAVAAGAAAVGAEAGQEESNLPRWAEELGALAPAQPLRGCPLAAPGNDQQVRRREARKPSGQGMHVPSAAAAGERRAGRALRFL
ncbi:hypothetical protein MC885_017932, partial [Smutsia gigantea]